MTEAEDGTTPSQPADDASGDGTDDGSFADDPAADDTGDDGGL
jgi:hypothetical protein